MLKELQLHGHNLKLDDIKSDCFTAIEQNFKRVSVPPFFVPYIVDAVEDNIVVGALIDFPYGMSNTKVRQHATLDALRHGANAIDLVINAHWLLNDKHEMVREDIETHKNICDKHNALLKVMVDYRRLKLMEIKSAFSILWNCGITDAMVATGHFMDKFIDQFCIISVLQASYINKIQLTMNGTINSTDHLAQLDKAKIGARLHSGHAIRILFPAKTTSGV